MSKITRERLLQGLGSVRFKSTAIGGRGSDMAVSEPSILSHRQLARALYRWQRHRDGQGDVSKRGEDLYRATSRRWQSRRWSAFRRSGCTTSVGARRKRQLLTRFRLERSTASNSAQDAIEGAGIRRARPTNNTPPSSQKHGGGTHSRQRYRRPFRSSGPNRRVHLE